MSEENASQNAPENCGLEAGKLNRRVRVQDLVNRYVAHDDEAAAMDEERRALNLSLADIKKIRATQKTLAALMGEGIMGDVSAVQS